MRKGPKKAATTTEKAKPRQKAGQSPAPAPAPTGGKPASLIDTRLIYCGDNLDQLRKLPDQCVDLIYIDPPFNSNRNYEVFWGETKALLNAPLKTGTPVRKPTSTTCAPAPRVCVDCTASSRKVLLLTCGT